MSQFSARPLNLAAMSDLHSGGYSQTQEILYYRMKLQETQLPPDVAQQCSVVVFPLQKFLT